MLPGWATPAVEAGLDEAAVGLGKGFIVAAGGVEVDCSRVARGTGVGIEQLVSRASRHTKEITWNFQFIDIPLTSLNIDRFAQTLEIIGRVLSGELKINNILAF